MHDSGRRFVSVEHTAFRDGRGQDRPARLTTTYSYHRFKIEKSVYKVLVNVVIGDMGITEKRVRTYAPVMAKSIVEMLSTCPRMPGFG